MEQMNLKEILEDVNRGGLKVSIKENDVILSSWGYEIIFTPNNKGGYGTYYINDTSG